MSMEVIARIGDRREAVLAQLRAIRSMRRGTLNEQFLEVPQKGKRKPALRGPYYVWSRKENKRTVSRRVCPGPELERMKSDLDNYRRFCALCSELEELTEQLGELERRAVAQDEALKKRRKPPSNRTGK